LRYPEVEIVRSTSANTVIPKLDRILSTHGIPREIKSDNGTPFQSHSFAQFAQYMGVSPPKDHSGGHKIQF
jgi:transposase InsO family protein